MPKQRNLIIGLVIILLAIFAIVFNVSKNRANNSAGNSTGNSTSAGEYNNFGISFHYPKEWGIPQESFFAGLINIAFKTARSDGPGFNIRTDRDYVDGQPAVNETLDDMINKFKKNNKNITEVKNLQVDAKDAREVFYNSAVTGKPMAVDLYIGMQKSIYLAVNADYETVSQEIFDSIIKTLKWDTGALSKTNPDSGIIEYRNSGVSLDIPSQLDTKYASLVTTIHFGKIDESRVDSNGCFPAINDSGSPSTSTVSTINGLRFCLAISDGVGAGQRFMNYSYSTVREGTPYIIDYLVSTANTCGGYQAAADANDPSNKVYRECLDDQKHSDTLVLKPIKDSIATFKFTN
jgi:hypothetical protein